MKIETFQMERTQSIWENQVQYNLSESGVHALRVSELGCEDLNDVFLSYPQTNGSIELRERISAFYPGTGPDHVLVGNGTAEMNFIAVWNLVEPGDEVVMMLPNYMQIWGLAESMGATVKPLWLRETNGRWAPDLNQLENLVDERTKLIAICNPNNPTGGILTKDEMRSFSRIAGNVGAWILADEVYQGAELSGQTTPSFHGSYDRLLVNCGLSKVYGLPGLRIGWTVGPRDKIAELWSYKDYTTIGPGAVSDRLARVALEPTQREKLFSRTRETLKKQLPIVETWAKEHDDILRMIRPLAGAITFFKYDLNVNSTVLFERLRDEKSVFVVPGDHFGMDHFLRIGFGGERHTLEEGLKLTSELLATLRTEAHSLS